MIDEINWDKVQKEWMQTKKLGFGAVKATVMVVDDEASNLTLCKAALWAPVYPNGVGEKHRN